MNNFYSNEVNLNEDPNVTPDVPQEPEVPQEPDQGQQNTNVVGDMAQKGGEEIKKQASKRIKKEVTKKAATSAASSAASASLMASLSYVLFWVALVILIIFVIIGLIMFFVTMPGMVMEKLKALFEEVGKFLAAFFGADTTQFVEDEDIFATLDYLEQMGWDIKAEGFLTDYYDDEADFPSGYNDDNGKKLDERTGVFRDDDDKIIAAESDFIFTYIVSDNYVYTIKNGNLATQGSEFWFLDLVTGFLTGIYNLLNTVLGPVFDVLGITELTGDAWGTGLLAFYYDNGVGIEGQYVNTRSIWDWNAIEVDVKSKKLKITRTELFNHNNPMEFSLDGWTGRYGMPVEFLLSVHKATMMPDLAFDMATSFNTNVNIYLHDVTGEAICAYKTKDGKYITIEELNKALTGVKGDNPLSDFWSWLDNLYQDDKEVITASAMGIDHADPCKCEKGTIEGYVKKGTSTTVYKDDDGKLYIKDTNGDKIYIPDDTPLDVTVGEYFVTICDECRAYLSKVIEITRQNDDDKFKAFSPYIANVTDHWYRDVYFVVNNKNYDFVEYDYDYETVMKERWTLYETYEEGEKIGEFKLYRVNEDGSLGDLYDGTYDEAEEEGIKVIKKAKTFNSSDKTALADFGWNQNSSGVWSAYEESSGTETGFERFYLDEELGEGLEAQVKARIFINLKTTGNIVQVGEGQRTETNNEIKKMFLHNTYFRYDGSEETAEIITKLRKDHEIDYGPLDDEDLEKTVTIDNETFTAKDFTATVSLNQDSLNAFSMLENTHTLDSDYIYRDFKELIVELGYFTKEELTDETPRLLQFPIPEIGSAGYPDRAIDKVENEFGTMIHSKGDIEANEINSIRAQVAALVEDVQYGSDELMTDIIDNVDEDEITNVNEDVFELMSSIELTEVGAVKKTRRPSQVSLREFLQTTEEMCLTINECGYDYCVNRPVIKEDGTFQDGCTCTEDCKKAFPAKLACSCGDSCEVVHCAHTVHRNPCKLPETFEESQESQLTYNFCCNFLVRWALINVGVYDTTSPYAIGSMATHLIENLDGKKIEPGEPLKPGDILFYDSYAHVDIKAEDGLKFNGGHPADKGSQKGQGNSSINEFHDWTGERPPEFAVRLNWGQQNDGDYEGYNGNEAVVSPVTGILLEYGTYDADDKDGVTQVEYRENVDMKYGRDEISPLVKEETPQTPPANGQQKEEEPVIDKVGYAKILVLDAENYEKLQAKVTSRWQSSSKIVVKESKNEGTTNVTSERNTESVTYLDVEGFNTDMIEDDNWTERDITVYGYKEFAESYEYAGIAGNVIYIDGFIAETPDESIFFDEESGDDPKDMWKENPSGTPLKMSDFIVNQSSLEDYPDSAPQTLYEADKVYKLASIKATEKSEAIAAVKEMAAPAVTISDGGKNLIFIKEGTILGRTITDKELLEEVRKDPEEDYDYYRPELPENKEDKKKEEYMHKVMGNYLRIIMRDLDGTVIENVEDYMKLDEQKKSDQEYQFREGDLEILADAIQHEGCGHYCADYLDTDDPNEILYLSISTGFTIINKLNRDSGFTPDYNDPSNLWDNTKSPLYNLLCRIPDRDDLQALADKYGYTTGRHKGWYAIAPELRHRIETDSLKYCDTCLEAAEYIRDNDSRNFANNGKFGSQFATGEEMPHTMWQQGGNYNTDVSPKLWLWLDKNKDGVKNKSKHDYYLYDTAK